MQTWISQDLGLDLLRNVAELHFLESKNLLFHKEAPVCLEPVILFQLKCYKTIVLGSTFNCKDFLQASNRPNDDIFQGNKSFHVTFSNILDCVVQYFTNSALVCYHY